MEVYYQGTDITDMVRVNSCIVRDTAGVGATAWKLSSGTPPVGTAGDRRKTTKS